MTLRAIRAIPRAERMASRDAMGVSTSVADRVILGVVLVALVAWSLTFIWGSSFRVEGERYFCLFDDAMISMTYARNLVEGYGFEWSRHGAPVEGYTHPLWLLPMILVNLSGLELATRSLPIQLFSLGLLVANVIAIHRLTARHFSVGRASYPWVAVVLTAAFYPLNYWSLLGMEMALQVLLITLGVGYALDLTERRLDRVVRLAVVCSLAALLRLDMALFIGAVLAFVLWRGDRKTVPNRSWWIGAAVLFGPLIAYQVFRMIYFGDHLPNTYYLKMDGFPAMARVSRGLRVGWQVVSPMLGSFVGTLVLSAALATQRRYRHFVLPIALVLAYFGYSVWVGGDAWEYFRSGANRFQSIVMPLLFVLVAASINVLASWLDAGLDRGMRGNLMPALGLLAVLGVGAQVNGLDDEAPHAEKAWDRLTQHIAPELVPAHYFYTRDAVRLRRALPRSTRVAVVWAGITAYFTEFQMVDLMGYNDYEIAHGPPRRRWDGESDDYFYPGHMKWNLSRTIAMHDPELFWELWRPEPSETALLESRGYVTDGRMWMSPEVARALARR